MGMRLSFRVRAPIRRGNEIRSRGGTALASALPLLQLLRDLDLS